MINSCGKTEKWTVNIPSSLENITCCKYGDYATFCTWVVHVQRSMKRRGGPGDRGGCEGAVAAGLHLCLHPHALCGATGAGRGLVLVPDTGQQQRAEPGVQSRAGSRVWMEHGVVVAGGDVRVGMVDVVDSRVATRALGVQAVGPAVRQVRGRWEPTLGEQVVGPKAPVWMV